MNAALPTPNLAETLAALYAEADAPLPTPARPVAPLDTLTRAYSLACVELPALTGRQASDWMLRRGGLTASLEEANDAPLAGFLYANAGYGTIFVERNDPIVRRRFSVAHELGHYLLHFRPLLAESDTESGLDWATDAFPYIAQEEDATLPPNGQMVMTLPGDIPPPQAQFERMEDEANTFAAMLLMPAPLVRALFAHYAAEFHSEELSWRLASDLLVSHAALRRRLCQLALPLGKPAHN